MKTLYIISCYANTEEKKLVLKNYINQIKKISTFDILLVSHIPISEDLISLVNYYIYDSDNFLLPLENTPVTWIVYGNIKIDILSCRHGYAVMKNIHNSVMFARFMEYDNFIFSDYDNILGDEDIDKISNIPNLLKENDKKIFVFKDYNVSTSRGYSYESKFFAGDVNYFVTNVTMPNSYQKWLITEPYKSSSNVLEDILVLLLNKLDDRLYKVEQKINEYFSHSQFDVFHHYDYVHSVIYNSNDKSKPLFFCITPEDGVFELLINNESAFNISCNKQHTLLHFFDVNELDTELVFKLNGRILFKRIVNSRILEDIKKVAVVSTI